MEQRYPQREDIVVAIRRLREALLKSSPLAGFPRVKLQSYLTDWKAINGLSALNEAIPNDVKDELGATPHLRYLFTLRI
jgi:hypothetical protein